MAGIITIVPPTKVPKAPKAPKSRKAAPTGVGRNLLAGQVNQSAAPRTRTTVAKTQPVPLPKPTNTLPKATRPGGYGGKIKKPI